jgi:hypothetical protein
MRLDPATGEPFVGRGYIGLWADEHGLIVRNPLSKPRRYAWADVSHFASGRTYDEVGRPAGWRLVVVLKTGRDVPVHSTTTREPESLWPGIQRVADQYGILAELSAPWL